MNLRRNYHNKKFSALVLLVFFMAQFSGVVFSQSIESVRKKIENKNYSDAKEELRQLLQTDSKNAEAQKLLHEIHEKRLNDESKKFLEKAQIQIDNRKFEKAMELIKQAIAIDPKNSQARDLYVRLQDVIKIEREHQNEEERKKREQQDKIQRKKEKIEFIKRRNNVSLSFSFNYSFVQSNNVNFINSNTSGLGLRLDARYFFSFLNKNAGISIDYFGYLLQAQGNSKLNSLIHRLNVSLRFRLFFFERWGGKFITGVRANYHFFYRQNLNDIGIYKFTSLYGPTLGIFVSGPFIFRFDKKRFIKQVGIEGGVDYLYMAGMSQSPSILEYYAGAYYHYRMFKFGAGYRSFSLKKGSVTENCNSVEIK